MRAANDKKLADREKEEPTETNRDPERRRRVRNDEWEQHRSASEIRDAEEECSGL
jgi:hypothetical protein